MGVTNQGGLLNIEIVPGVDLVLSATMKTEGVPIDLTGHVFTGRVVDPATKATLASIDVTVDSPESNGTITIHATAAVTELLRSKVNSDLKWHIDSDASGVVTRWLYGTARISN